MKLDKYKKGDRVKYIFLGDCEGVVKSKTTKLGMTYLIITLDKPAPIEFNMGNRDVMALGPSYVELIS